MKISTRSRYGLRMLIALGLNKADSAMFLGDIAKNENLSEKYLSQLVIPLKRYGLIRAERGVHGGYSLAKDPKEITLTMIIEALDGPLTILDCVQNEKICERSDACKGRGVWSGLEKTMREFCSTFTLSNALESEKTVNFADFI